MRYGWRPGVATLLVVSAQGAFEQRARNFDLVLAKLDEADRFLGHLEAAAMDVSGVRSYFSAFVSAARSMTFALQATLRGVPGFAEWYEREREGRFEDELGRFFLERRNEVIHVGETRINAGTFERIGGELVIRHFFAGAGPEDDFEPLAVDVVTACRSYLGRLRALVAVAEREFACHVDPDWLFDEHHLASVGLTIEDVEEQLGFPRGWTAVGEALPRDRLAALRDATPVEFARYLGRKIIAEE